MKLRRIAAMAALAAAASGVAASHGEAGGGTPIVSCGQTVTQNAFLTTDLSCPGSSGIVVGAAGITIDLKGHTLRGDRTFGHHGVDDTGGFDRLAVKNGVVRNFYDGVHAVGDRVGVSGLVVSGNAKAGVYVLGDAAKIQSVTAGGNAPGINLVGDSGSVKSVTASRNTIGVSVSGASATIQSSTASGNSVGISVIGASAKIRSSTVTGNSSDGISVSGASATVLSSTATGNYYGISISGSSANVQSATAVGNVNYGVLVLGESAAIQGSSIAGNGTGGVGVNGNAALIAGNHVEVNGFYLDADDAGLGIIVQGYTMAPAGKNVARGNDDPHECDPVSLC